MIFTDKMEDDLDDHITNLANMFYGLSVKECRQLLVAYEFAVQNKVEIPESWNANQMAGKQ